MWELDCEESWVTKNCCFWTEVLEKTLESPWDCKEMKPVNPKGNKSWIFIGRTDAEAEALILQPPDVNNWLLGSSQSAGKNSKGRKRGGWQRMRWLDGIIDLMDMSWWWTGRPGMLQSMGLEWVGHDCTTELNWTEPQREESLLPKTKLSGSSTLAHLSKCGENIWVAQVKNLLAITGATGDAGSIPE